MESNSPTNPRPESNQISCHGCEIDHPSQVEHMGPGGCLNQFEDQTLIFR